MCILIDAEWNKRRCACYEDERLESLYDRPMSLRDVLTRCDGEWALVSRSDRVWVASRALPEDQARLFACEYAERVLARRKKLGYVVSAECVALIDTTRSYAIGGASHDEVVSAASVACSYEVPCDYVCRRVVSYLSDWSAATAMYFVCAMTSEDDDGERAWQVARLTEAYCE